MNLEIRLERLHSFDLRDAVGKTIWPNGCACLNDWDGRIWTHASNGDNHFVLGLKNGKKPNVCEVPFKGQLIYRSGGQVVIGPEFEDITAILHLRNGELEAHDGSLVDACSFNQRVYTVADPFASRLPVNLDHRSYVILYQDNIPFKGIPLYIASCQRSRGSPRESYLLTVDHSDEDMKKYMSILTGEKDIHVTGNPISDARWCLEKDTTYHIYRVKSTKDGSTYPVRGKKVFSGKASRILGFAVQDGIAYIADGFELKAVRLDRGEYISLSISREDQPFKKLLNQAGGTAPWPARGLCATKLNGRTTLGIVTGCSVELYGVSSVGFRN